MNELITINNVRGFIDNSGTAQLNLEDVSRGLGFIDTSKGEIEYVRWNTVSSYLKSFGFSQEVAKDTFIPENIFYRLAMKAKNETAEIFQATVADEILPSIRKHGMYAKDELLDNPDLMIEVLQQLKKEREERKLLESRVGELTPKADYYDDMAERNRLTNFRDTAKELKIKESDFIELLEIIGYVYRDGKNRIKPHAQYVPELFEIKEFVAGNGFSSSQTLITHMGREKFRVLSMEGRLCQSK